MNAIELEGIHKRYGRVRALRGVSLEVPLGVLCLVTGPNGAGKSTLLRVLACLTRPTRGALRILGDDPFRSALAATRGRVGYLGAEPALYGQLSVQENLAFCARLHGVARARIGERIADFGLDAVRDRLAGGLSSGFRRRVGLARALLAAPDVLLLDEPWNGLDAEACERLAGALAGLRARGATALVAAHADEARAARFDRVIRIERGELVGDGPPASGPAAGASSP